MCTTEKTRRTKSYHEDQRAYMNYNEVRIPMNTTGVHNADVDPRLLRFRGWAYHPHCLLHRHTSRLRFEDSVGVPALGLLLRNPTGRCSLLFAGNFSELHVVQAQNMLFSYLRSVSTHIRAWATISKLYSTLALGKGFGELVQNKCIIQILRRHKFILIDVDALEKKRPPRSFV